MIGRVWVACVAMGWLFGCDTPVATPDASDAVDASRDAAAVTCTGDAQCDDGAFCNGTERCVAGSCTAGTAITCPSGQSCDEAADACTGGCATPDADGDSRASTACGGDDCDDDDPDRFPGNAEACDASHDEDCNPATVGSTDADSDGHVSSACCNGDTCGDDCEDSMAAVFTGASEMCNGLDDDCDGTSDEGLSVSSYHPDCDGDGAGAQGSAPSVGCGSPAGGPSCTVALPGAGWALSSGDCDDANPDVGPGTTELCNGRDDNCNGSTDEGVVPTCYQDLDGDGRGNPASMVVSCTCPAGYVAMAGDCNDTPGIGASIHTGATELCDGYDNNCNSALDYPGEDDDGDGYADAALCAGAPNATDCNDTNMGIHPGATEIVANGVDDDCSGQELCYVDSDHDGYGSSATVSTSDIPCTPAMGHARMSGDCCDTESRAYPGQTSYFSTPRAGCGGYDFNCASGDELEPLTMSGTSTGTCATGPSCDGSTLTPGWVGGPPTSCGQAATYRSGCVVRAICFPSCVNVCGVSSTSYTQACR